ncbi:LPS translocon maturation chaperone LptM [Thalassotalea piscium]
MRKLNSLNLAWLLVLLLLSGCGMPGPLYQTPEIKANETPPNTQSSNQTVQENS